jgi:hypothetical protein
MSEATLDPLEYYARPGPMTDPRDQADLFRDLPTAIPALCQVVQGVLLHIFWAERYGVKLSEERKQEVNIRPAAQRLARIRQVNRLPLVIPRPVEERQVGNCHDFSTLLCAMLRYQGVPARARCGFGKYFVPEHFERLRECETKIDDLCRPFEAHIAHLDTVTGVDQRAAQDALAEIGMDMSHFPSYKHLSSWARICPGNTESAGKRKRGADRERRPVGESHPGPVCPRRRWHHRHLSESTVPALCPAQRQEASGRSRRP